MAFLSSREAGAEALLDFRLVKKVKTYPRMELGEHTMVTMETMGRNLGYSPFDSIPLEVLGNIFLEYFYDEEVQQSYGYSIGANWERWSRPGTTPSIADLGGHGTDDGPGSGSEQRLGHPGAVLGLVSRSWRKAYLSTPRLWSTIRIWLNFPYTFYSAQSFSQWNRKERDLIAISHQIQLHLCRSRAAPLSIEIQTNCFNASISGGASAAGEALGRVLQVFERDMWRIQDLVVKRTDHARTQTPLRGLPIPPGTTGLATPPGSASPRSPCSGFGFRNPITADDGALSALEQFITKLERLRNLTLDNWSQDSMLNLVGRDDEAVLPGLKNLILLSSSPAFCCNGIPWRQITKFTSSNCKYNYGQLLDMLEAMPMLTHCDVKMSYNEPGVTASPYPSPYPSPLPSPSPTHSRSTGFFTGALERDGSASPRRHLHVHLPFLTHLSLQGLPKSIQLLLCSLKTKELHTLKLSSYEAGIGMPQILSDQSPCESLFRFLRRSQCNLEWMRVDAMFLVPPQPTHQNGQRDPKYIYSYMLKADFAPLQPLKTLIIGRGHPEMVEKLLLTLAWKGDPQASDLFPNLEEFGCEMKLGYTEANALAGLVMSRIPSGVVFIRQPSEGRRHFDTANARLWPISPPNSFMHYVPHQELKKYPTRLRLLHVPSSKSNINVTMRHHFCSWFPDFPHDPEFFLPRVLC